MSTLATILIVVGAVLLLLFIGGYAANRRRVSSGDYARHVSEADHALEAARAADKGWDRTLLDEAARAACAEAQPGFGIAEIHLVLVDDRPGVVDDRAHFVALDSAGKELHVVLTREHGGSWVVESVA